MNKRYITILILSVLATGGTEAKVRLPHIISSGMVVQRDKPLTLWGAADPGETVSLKVGKNKAVRTEADANGKWRAELPALKPGKPYTITINDITLNDVLVGDVLLCSGQSNMELPVNRVTDMFADDIAAYKNPAIRQFKVPKEVDIHEQRADVSDGSWKSVNDDAMNFSALAYFTARSLNERTGLPVGIINASWGGTPVEAWISEDNLGAYPLALAKKHLYDDDAYRERIKALEGENFARWNALLRASDPGMNASVKWYDPEFDDSGWPEYQIPLAGVNKGLDFGTDSHCAWDCTENWATDGLNAINGSHWFRKTINLPAKMADKEGTVRMGCIVDADSVYVNGTFVGTTGYQYPPRIYKVPAGLLKEGKNVITVRLISQNGRGHFVPEKPYKLIVGNDEVPLTGRWRYHRGAEMPNSPGMMFWCYQPAVLYNSMVSPLLNYPVKGVVWYQGESNVSRRNEYCGLLKTLIANWREDFNDANMPFYIVELADFLHPSDKGGRGAWAEMRKYQAQVADETPDTYLIRNSDLGEWNDIHPLDKKTLGTRVADAILNKK